VDTWGGRPHAHSILKGLSTSIGTGRDSRERLVRFDGSSGSLMWNSTSGLSDIETHRRNELCSAKLVRLGTL
jgi:hypothetical protein